MGGFITMTLPYEEQRSLHYAHQFLFDLLDPKKTPKVPRAIRQRASHVLHHYPFPHRIDDLYGIAMADELARYKDENHVKVRYEAK